MKCTDDFITDSECKFSCRRGFKMIGSHVSKCDMESKRYHPAPKCVIAKCPAIRKIDNGGVECTRRYKIRSVCRFFCDDGYTLEGMKSISCWLKHNNDYGIWSRPPPECTRRQA
ncbi:zona pellucida sperm-binding protein 3 receptor-like [Clavelina lepadiformis]|uniref:zona pellucida sperm-binding protein 3 receptor-like n=1 Tax=Clavelina lepadiformis TaxID=159417 RepID=UPI004040EDE0